MDMDMTRRSALTALAALPLALLTWMRSPGRRNLDPITPGPSPGPADRVGNLETWGGEVDSTIGPDPDWITATDIRRLDDWDRERYVDLLKEHNPILDDLVVSMERSVFYGRADLPTPTWRRFDGS